MVLLVVVSCLLASCEKSPEKTAPLKAEVGQPAPDFSLTDTKGRTWRLTDLRGQVVFVNFWATWCPPCREELPSMEGLHRRLSQAPFQMLTILNNDRPDFAQQVADKYGYTFPILIDPDSKVAGIYGITGVPETFIIDANGVLQKKFIGPWDWNSPPAWKMLAQFLPEGGAAPFTDMSAH